ncbi:MAG TPA: isoprenylcysteine carboxylmethyltransferase family protein [Mycobacterium sp.]|jgi:protein-S-isoprenylcysteine O-methyltransferase Ste14|nr:isoprenylcysteine carboxylmethyltransferase family protein [Mycobacterium sp.]
MKTTFQMLAYTVFSILFFGLMLFWPAGTFDYWQAWVFIAVFVVATMVPTIYLAVKYPDALRRRTRSGPFAETRVVQKLINIGIILAVVAAGVVGGLDHRFGWSAVPIAVVVLGNALVVIGLSIAELVVIQNNYAAATITVEKDQPVVSTGLYGLVRHPMYVGALIMMVGMPLALASYWALLTIIPGVLVFAARITDEEKALRQDLDGYEEYTGKVHYRLVPGVW